MNYPETAYIRRLYLSGGEIHIRAGLAGKGKAALAVLIQAYEGHCGDGLFCELQERQNAVLPESIQ